MKKIIVIDTEDYANVEQIKDTIFVDFNNYSAIRFKGQLQGTCEDCVIDCQKERIVAYDYVTPVSKMDFCSHWKGKS